MHVDKQLEDYWRKCGSVDCRFKLLCDTYISLICPPFIPYTHTCCIVCTMSDTLLPLVSAYTHDALNMIDTDMIDIY